MQFSYLIFIYAFLLISDSVFFQILAPARDPSILSPAIFGGILVLMGVMTLIEDLQLYGKHGATALSLIAFIFSLNSLIKLIKNFQTDQNYENLSNSVMAILSISFLFLAVYQFARDRKKTSEKN